MITTLQVSDLTFRPARPQDRMQGLLGWCEITITINGGVRLHSVAVRTTRDQRLVLSFPSRHSRSGSARRTASARRDPETAPSDGGELREALQDHIDDLADLIRAVDAGPPSVPVEREMRRQLLSKLWYGCSDLLDMADEVIERLMREEDAAARELAKWTAHLDAMPTYREPSAEERS